MTESLRPAAARRGLTDTALKGIAVVSMVLDHIYYFFGYTGCIPTWCSMVGRLAAPLFLFCLVEGFVHTSNRKKYFFRVWVLAAPMGLLLFFMRYGGWLTRPDGFYPENSMLSTSVLLLLFYQGFEWIASRRASKVVLGLALVVFLVLWPQLAGRCTLLFPQTATVFGALGYAVLPMMNFTGDLSLPVILVGLALYFAKRSRIAQVIALNVVSFGWHFVLVYLQVRTWPDFQMVQMFTTYYEWMGGLLATPLLLCYNGQRGAGYRRFFYAFYPAHIYILYALSWLLLLAMG